MSEFLRCDNCGKNSESDHAMGWRKVEAVEEEIAAVVWVDEEGRVW